MTYKDCLYSLFTLSLATHVALPASFSATQATLPVWSGDVWKMANECLSPLLDTKKFLPDTNSSLKYHST